MRQQGVRLKFRKVVVRVLGYQRRSDVEDVDIIEFRVYINSVTLLMECNAFCEFTLCVSKEPLVLMGYVSGVNLDKF